MRAAAFMASFSSGPATAPAPSRPQRELLDECEFQCDCADGSCIACELKALAGDLPALLLRADDACACEQYRLCRASAIADVVRRGWRL